MRYFFLMMLFFSINCFGRETIDHSQFSVEANVSSDAISLDQDLIFHVQLKYPSGFHPDVDLMKRRLLSYAGFSETPFSLAAIEMSPPQATGKAITQQIKFVLSPQQSGKHYLTLRLIPFVSDGKDGKTVEIPSDIFTIHVMDKTAKADFASLIESPMPLSRKLPVTISQTNKMTYLKNRELLEQEEKSTLALLKSKSFPWINLIAALGVLSTIIIIRLSPSEGAKKAIEEKTKEQIDREIKQEIQKISEIAPQNPVEMDKNILQLDFQLRRYLTNKYGFPAFSCTIQELRAKIEELDAMPSAVKEGMNDVFQKADQIKFSHESRIAGNLQGLDNWVSIFSQL